MNTESTISLKLNKTGLETLIGLIKNSNISYDKTGIMAFFLVKKIYLRLLTRYANMKPKRTTTFSMNLAEAIAVRHFIELRQNDSAYNTIIYNEINTQIHQIIIS